MCNCLHFFLLDSFCDSIFMAISRAAARDISRKKKLRSLFGNTAKGRAREGQSQLNEKKDTWILFDGFGMRRARTKIDALNSHGVIPHNMGIFTRFDSQANKKKRKKIPD